MPRSATSQAAVPRVRPGHQPGLRRLGRHLRGGAPQAPPGLARPPAPRLPEPRRSPRSDVAAAHAVGVGHAGSSRPAPDRRPCPAAVAGSQLDRAAQLRRHQRAHDRQPEAGRACSSVKPSGRPDAVVDDLAPTSSRAVAAAASSTTSPAAELAAVGIGVVDGVLQQLGEHDAPAAWPPCAGSVAGVALDAEAHRPLGRRAKRLLDHPARAGRTISTNGTSSPASRRQDLVHEGDRARPAAPTPRSPPSPRVTSSRRPCSRSSDEIVCRLFFTRWWISRMVASFDSSSRSRRRSSEMSRSSTTAPVTVARRSSSGMQRSTTVTSGPRSTSSVTGTGPCERGARSGASSRPSSPRRMPSVLACTPTRCSADTRVRRRVLDPPLARRAAITPSPTAGHVVGLGVLGGNGNSPAAIIRANRLKIST